MSLREKHVIVAGGGSGIGLGVARAALAEGATVTLAGRTPEKLAHAAGVLGAAPGDAARVRTAVADISREGDVARLFAAGGPVDHVVVTAVSAYYQPVAQLELPEARRAIDSKLIGPLLVAKHASGRLREGGSITFTAGINAHRPAAGGAVLAAANGALEALGRALAVEMAPVRVNVVAPGWVDTPVWEVVAGPRKAEVLGAMAARLPAGRVGTPEDLAHAYLFLMANAFTTGIVLHVDGGHRLA